MPITKFTRGNMLHAVGNRAVRNAISGLMPSWSTAYEETTPTLAINRVNNSAALIPEPNLTVDVAGGGFFYEIRGKLYVTTLVTTGIKLDFAGGTANILAGSMGGFVNFYSAAALASSANQTALNTGAGATALVTSVEFCISGQFTDPGQVTLRFAQNAAGASNTDILQGSYIMATPLDMIVASA